MTTPPPPTRRTDDCDTWHGVRVNDPYRWLEDVDAPEVQEWMSVQDEHARSELARLPERKALLERFRSLFYYDAVSCPSRRGERLFYTRKQSDSEKAIVYWRDGDGDEHVLFDPNAMSEDGSISLGVWVPSRDGTLVAYALRENNADAATLYVRDIDTGQDLEADVLPGAKYATPAWLPDGSGFYYTRLPEDPEIHISELPGHAEICFHAIGTGPETDRVVHTATGSPQTFISCSVSRDGNYLIVQIQHGWNSTDTYIADRRRSDTEFHTVVEGVAAIFGVTAWRNQLFICTNDAAPRYRVLHATTIDQPRSEWREIVPESDATLESADVVGDHLVLTYLRNAHAELRLATTSGEDLGEIALPGIGSIVGMTGNAEEPHLYFGYSSFTEPTKIFHAELPNTTPTLWAEVSTNVDTSAITVDQHRYHSKDGTAINLFLLRRSDIKPTGSNPTILYGYGGFSHSLTPTFSPAIVPWLERGGVYAIANLRGGGECGEDWHKAGMLLEKQNVFDDFIAAAEYLIDSGWTTREKLAIRGGSNGGLLVGAAMTQRPELFRAVVCAVPLLDMLRYHLFGSGKTWVPEYGSAEDEQQFGVIHAYSPYHNTEEGVAYPSLLMLANDSDDRVDPMHARKFVAMVRHATSSSGPVLLRIERNAGHTGADMVAKQVEQAADTYAFLVDQLES